MNINFNFYQILLFELGGGVCLTNMDGCITLFQIILLYVQDLDEAVQIQIRENHIQQDVIY